MALDHGSMIEELRQRMTGVEPLKDEPQFFTETETLTRFLKAREWNLDAAEKQLRATVEWRRNTHPLEQDCKWCHESPGYHSLRQVGFDEMGRPVIYSNFAQASTRKLCVEDSVAHVTHLVENAKRTMRPGVNSWVFVMDCTGMTLPSCNPKLGYGVSQILSNHYPERLGLVICINHSPVFQGVWAAIKVFMQPATTAKVQLVRSKKKMKELFSTYFSEEMSSWILKEIKLNKLKPLAKSQKEFWRGGVTGGGDVHDPRGSPSYVREHVDGHVRCSGIGLPQTHIPHPNIVDYCLGRIKDISPPQELDDDDNKLGHIRDISPPQELEDDANKLDVAMANQNNNDNDSDELNDNGDNFSDIDIDEEFQIPKDAKLI